MSLATVTLVLHAAVTLAGASATGATPTGTWRFRVLLGDREIGTHTYRVERDGDAVTARSEARFKVSLLFVTAYRYTHTATERWSEGCLRALEARTEDGSRRRSVRAERTDGGLEVVTGDGSTERLDLRCPMTFAYWDPSILGRRRLLNAQTGQLEEVRVDTLGVESVPARGREAPARRFAVTAGALRIDLWYDLRTGEWVRLETTARGRPLTYLLQ